MKIPTENMIFTVDAPQEKVWKVFLDPTQLCKVLPGCEGARQLDATHYEAVMSVKVQFMTIRGYLTLVFSALVVLLTVLAAWQ